MKKGDNITLTFTFTFTFIHVTENNHALASEQNSASKDLAGCLYVALCIPERIKT